MKDYHLRIGMRFVEQGREFVIEGPLPENQLKVRDTVTEIPTTRSKADLLEALFAGELDLIGDGNQPLEALEQRQGSDLTLLDDGDPLKAEALRRLHYVEAVIRERLVSRTRETLSPIIEQVSAQIKDENPPSWSTLKRWSRIYERSARMYALWFRRSKREATARRSTPAAVSRPSAPKISTRLSRWRRSSTRRFA